MLSACAMLVACGDDDESTDFWGSYGSSDSSDDEEQTDVSDIDFDTSFLDEGTEEIPSDDNDYVENSTFNYTLEVVYSEVGAEISGDTEMVDVEVDGGHVVVTSETKGMAYVLSGECSDGSFKIYSDYKMKLTLNGLTLTNPEGAAINDQCGKSMYVVLADGTENTLTDGSSYTIPDDEDMKGTFFSEGQLLFSGAGTLNVNANYKNGIVSDDYIVFRPGNVINVRSSGTNGVKANDGVTVRGGVLNVGVTAAGSKGINSEANVLIEGGRTTLITTGGTTIEDNDTKSCAGVKADSAFTMTAGELYIKSSGSGGKGINADTEVTIDGGTIEIVTTGKSYSSGRNYSASPKGIKADGNLTINDGDITVSTTGGDGAEGIESKSTMTINGGNIVVTAYDDALNASKSIVIAGGQVYAYSTGNDAIDSNGSLYFSGGTIIGLGASSVEGPFDCDQGTFAITGGNIIGMGGSISTPTTSATKQPVVVLGSQSYSSGTYLALNDSGGDNIFSFKVPVKYSQSVLVLSSPEMSVGSSYTIKSGVSVSGGTWWQGFSDDTSVSGGSTLKTLSLSSMVTTSGTTSTTMPGGGMGWR